MVDNESTDQCIWPITARKPRYRNENRDQPEGDANVLQDVLAKVQVTLSSQNRLRDAWNSAIVEFDVVCEDDVTVSSDSVLI